VTAGGPVRRLVSGELYHVGIVVEDLGAGKRAFRELFGVAWTERLGARVLVDGPDYRGEVDFEAVYSLSGTGPVRAELVQATPGTLWEAGAGLHHVGFWSEDLPADRARLVAHGYGVAADLHPDAAAEATISLHHGPQGMYVELVSAGLKPHLEGLWADAARLPLASPAAPARWAAAT
jgi:hypothetical protein